MSKNFISWKQTFDKLSSKQPTVPELKIDFNKLGDLTNVKALCQLQTKQVNHSF